VSRVRQRNVPVSLLSTYCAYELFRGYVGLAKHTCKRTDFHVCVHRHHTTAGLSPHDDVAARLSKLLETKVLQSTNDLGP
jgi:hypothetical protein